MIKVSEKLYRGGRPKSFKELAAADIGTVINLQSGVYEEMHDDNYEKESASDFGIIEHNLSLSDVLPPKDWQIGKIIGLIGASKKPVYIHCLHGKDRTGFVCAVYRMAFQKWTYEEAKREMFALGFHKFPYLMWLPELKKWS